MRLPRRVPWASLAELEHVCSSIYADENDIDAKIFAINRISAWKVITTLPHATESTLALLVVIVQDNNKQSSLPTLLLRQSYAAAVLRLVNGLVDPLQVGTYARPIASIAQQLGIPGWLVELRHAATHEDLPSIDLLREAARQSMAWLLQNYYLPTLNPAPTTQELEATPIRPLLPMLKFYKGTMKTMTRDVSLIPQFRPKLVNVLRDLERWIAECKVAANVAAGEIGWTAESTTDADAKEIWALERFAEGLAAKGMLVPLSKKKRHVSTGAFLPNKASVAFWEPLLRHVQAIHQNFPYIFCRKLIAILLSSIANPNDLSQRSDSSHETYLASWVMWAVETWNGTSSQYLDLRKDTLLVLMKGSRYEETSLSQNQSASLALLTALSSGHAELEVVTAMLLRPQSQFSQRDWNPHDLDIMMERNEQLQATADPLKVPKNTLRSASVVQQAINIPGWRLLDDRTEWKACPIGIYQLN